MFDQLFLTIHQWITGSGESAVLVGAAGSFLWGVVSVLFSPCHLASIPLIVAYVGGQEQAVEGRQAAWYAGLFTLGLFLTIAAVGVAGAMLGRMMGDVGPYWTILVGAILLWVAADMLGVARCSMASGMGGLTSRFRLRGAGGAFLLGLAYGVLSGSCTFGFIAPILAIITVQEQLATGIVYILLFGVGHAIPIAIAGSSTALVKRLLSSGSWQQGGLVFRRGAGVLIGLLGLYFVAQPFVSI